MALCHFLRLGLQRAIEWNPWSCNPSDLWQNSELAMLPTKEKHSMSGVRSSKLQGCLTQQVCFLHLGGH
jgi:hypothetical protein